MIETEMRTSPSGLQTKILRNGCCELKFFDVSNTSAPGKIRHTNENIYAPTATVSRDDKRGWEISITLPRVSISPDTWPRLEAAAKDILEFWEEVKELL